MKKIIIPIGALLITSLAHAQLTPTENYIYTKTYLSDPTLPTPKTSETVQYVDGLGRPKQVVNIKASPLGRDVVSHIEYDQFGRQTKDYLPVPQGGTMNGAIVPTPLANASQIDLYGSEKIYAEKTLENSPLDRILEQRQVGNAWSDKPVKFNYDANVSGEVIKYTAPTAWENGATKSGISYNGTYGTGQLYKNSVKDEDGNETIEFKNGKGQTLLVRKVLNATENADTYYVYNDYDQLAWVVPPLLAKMQTWGLAEQNALAYEYRYDGRGRLVEKKLPGKGWEYMVYDRADRLVLSQDTNLKTQGKWLITKYDLFGRVIYTGFLSGGERAARQNEISDLAITESRSTTGFTRNGITVYYTDYNFVGEIPTILSVNYYGNYPSYSFNPAFPADIQGATLLTQAPSADGKSTKGLPVMSLVKNIEDDNWTKNYSYYDTKGRAVGGHSINHLGGYTKTESQLDFVGVPLKSVTKHKRLDTDTEKVITENFEYDPQNRLKKHYHQIDSQPQELLAENSYNELSQLKNKKVGNNLQSIDYAYNIRGWMTKINDPANLNGKLFGYEIKYNNPVYTNIASGRYNGNIAEIDWQSAKDQILNRYTYQYDALDRLKSGIYSEPNASIPQNNYYNETLSYDLNGNITSLQRNRNSSNIGVELIDNLSYSYLGNRLNSVTDSSGNYFGYPDVSGNPIAYDNNGNMIDHVDKGILQIDYNYLNMPKYIKFSRFVTSRFGNSYENTNYTYRSDGVKLNKKYNYFSGRNQNSTVAVTDYLDGFQYKAETTLVFGESPTILQFVPTAEGYYDFVENKYIYQCKDQVGNIRLAFYKDALGNPVIDRANDFYPFGLEFGGSGMDIFNSISPNYTYTFQGQEKQEDSGWNSYKWRNYDPTMGRFFNIDPLSEKYAYQSHYNFSENRVVDARELEGLEAVDFRKNDGYKNLVVVVQGWSGDTKKGYTQSQNVGGSNNPDFKGKGNLDLTGIGGLVGLANSNTRVVVFDSSQNENTKNDLKSTISNFNNVHSDGVVAAVGHSLGGDNLVESVNENKNLKVDLMVTLDIMDSYSDTKIPSNVSKAVNYYQTKNIYGGEKIEPTSDNKTTKIVNVLAPTSDHKSIDNDLSTKVRDVVKRELIPNQ